MTKRTERRETGNNEGAAGETNAYIARDRKEATAREVWGCEEERGKKEEERWAL